MPRRRQDRVPAALYRRLVALLLATACGGSALFAQSGGESPVPIQRIVIPAERIAKELEKVQQGALIALPLPEFDARLERVRKALQARQPKPRLTRAHYSAELIDRSFTNGSGQWTIQHPGKAAAILAIDPFDLALHNLKWERGADAILGPFDGKTLGLLVEQAGTQSCLFDWSARGTSTSEGIAFSLAVPPCPINTFEFKIPADYWLTVPKNTALVTGPLETESSRKRLWKVQVTGQTQLELSLRKIAESKSPASVVFAQVQNTQQLAPERVKIDHEFQIDILHGSLRELTLDGDGDLQPYEVTWRSGAVKSWQWKPAAAKKDAKGKDVGSASGVLTIQFQQPVQGKIQGLRISSLAARPSGKPWTSPALRVRGALSRGETLRLLVDPNLPVGRWDHGSFQVTQVATESDGAQTITLADTAPDAAASRRPLLWPPTKNIDLHTTANYHWHLGNRAATLDAEILYVLAHGSLSELSIKLPATFPRYQLETVEMQPPELLHGWYFKDDRLVVELKQALAPARKASVKIHLRAAYTEITLGSQILFFPDLQPLDGTKREGTLAIFVDPILQAQLLNSTPPVAPFDESVRDKRQAVPSYFFALHDQRPFASVRLTPQPAPVRWHGKHTVVLSEQQAAWQFHWEVEPLLGAPDYLDLRFAPGFPASWRLKPDEKSLKFHYWERLPLPEALPHLLQLGARSKAQAALLESMLPTGTIWRFHLAEPLRSKASFTIEANAPAGMMEDDWRRASLLMPRQNPWASLGAALAAEMLPGATGAKIWSIPRLTPVQRLNVDQEFAIDSPHEPIDKAVADGSLAVVPTLGSDKSPLHLTAVQESNSQPDGGLNLTLWTRPQKRTKSSLELCDKAELTTYVHEDGRLTHRLQFRLWHWRDRTCDIRLPAGFQMLAARVADRWLDRIDVKEEPNSVRLILPFDQNAPFVRYEIFARSQAQQSYLPGMMTAPIPTIEWPVAPAELRSRWCLQKGLTPLDRETLVPVGVPSSIADRPASLRWLRQLWNAGESWWPYGEHAELLDKLESQKQVVLAAEAHLRREPHKSLKLADVLQSFAVHQLKDRVPLIIDRVALRSLGLCPETMVPAAALGPQANRPFWEALRLVYVASPHGALLTSAGRLKTLGIQESAQIVAIDDALQQAVVDGRDASAGFCLLRKWPELSPAESCADGAKAFAVADYLGEFEDMTEWETVSAMPPSTSVLVLDTFCARIVGVLLACLFGLMLWRIQRALPALVCFRVDLLLLTASVLITLWLSESLQEYFALPTVLVAGAAFACSVLQLLRRPNLDVSSGGSTVIKPAATAAMLCLLVGGAGILAQTAPIRAHPVLIVYGAKPTAFVTPELLTKLDELENQSIFSNSSAMLVNARYVGKVKDASVDFEVEYDVLSFKDQANLVLALAGVQLQEKTFLDGAPAFPTVHKNGYVLPIREKGVHHLRLSFSTRITTTGDQFDLRFQLPKLIQNQITLRWSVPAQAVHCINCRGEEKTTADARQAVQEWQAQLGYENDVHLRWTNSAALPILKTIEVKEAHFWDLRPFAPSLLSSLNYALGKGSLTQLGVAVPDGLHVRTVEATSLGQLPALPTPIVIKHWQMLGQGAQRRLLVDFSEPISGSIALNLEFVVQSITPTKPLRLPLPTALQGKSMSGLLGYRLDAKELETQAQNLSVRSIKAEDFEQAWKKQGSPTVPPATRAYSIQRNLQQAGAGLLVKIQPFARQAHVDLQWRVDLHYAELQANCTLTSLHEELMFLEFFIDPAMTLTDVTGPDLGRWYLQDTLLQVWLRQPCKQTTLKLAGWRAFDKNSLQQPKRRFVLPAVYPLAAQLAGASVQLNPARGVHVETEKTNLLRANRAGNLQWSIDGVPYAASFWLKAESSMPAASLLTKVEKTEQGIEIWHGIRIPTDRGKLPPLTLRLKDWPLESALLDAPGALVQPSKSKAANEKSWTIKYPPGLPQEVFLTLRVRPSTEKPGPIALPMVALNGVAFGHAWLAWKNVELVDAQTGAKLANDPHARAAIVPMGDGASLGDLTTWHCAEEKRPVKALAPKSPQPAKAERPDAGKPPALPTKQANAPLQADQARDSAEAQTRTELVLLVAVFILVFSYFRHGLSVLRVFAPEAAAGLIFAAMWLFGFGLVGANLLAAMILLRSFWIAAIMRRRLRLLSTEFELSASSSGKSPSSKTPPK